MVAQVTADQLRPVILLKAQFDSGDVRFWSGIGEITFNSEIYTGAGNLLSISEMTETVDIEAKGAVFQLSGLNSSIISIALSEPYQGRIVSCYFGVLDDTGAIVGDAILLFSGRMDVLQIDETGSTATLSMQAENKLIDLKKTKVRRYTPEDQRIAYPNDKGLEIVASLQDKEVTWGANSK